MENKFKANREFTSRPIWTDWREQLKESEINGLFQRLEEMDREKLVDWLQWYNPKGNYTDRKCMHNGVKPLCKSKAVEYTYKAILRNHTKKQVNHVSHGPIQLMFNN